MAGTSSKCHIQVDSFFTPAGIQRLDSLAFGWRCLAIAWLLALNATSKNKETLPHVTNTPHPPLPTDCTPLPHRTQTHLSTFTMDFLKNAVSGDNKGESNQQSQPTENSSGGGFLGGIGDKFNSAAGGGKESEKNEDMLDKGTSISAKPLLTPPRAQHTS